MINRERLVREFQTLASMNSPAGREGAVADVLEAELVSLGFQVCRDSAGDKVKGDTGNVIATKKGTIASAVPICFSAHMDTVTPTEKWGCRIEEGIIYSMGDTILGADDKAGIAAVMEAMRSATEHDLPHGDLQVVFTISEEVGLYGAKYLDYELIASECAFVYDMGKPVGCVVIAAPSHDNIVAKFRGKASHAGARPEDGISAIVTASKAIANMTLGRIDNETTANIGIIKGGTARNIVPDLCELKGEARSRDESKLDAQIQHMISAMHDAAAETGAEIDVTVERSYNAYRLSEDDRVIRIAVEAARRVGIEPELHETGGGSDASIFNSRGLPATVIGVGYDKAHSTDECMPIADLVKSAQIAVEIINIAAGH